MPVDRWPDKNNVYIYTVEYYSALKKSQIEFWRTIPITIASKNMKYLVINLTRSVNYLYTPKNTKCRWEKLNWQFEKEDSSWKTIPDFKAYCKATEHNRKFRNRPTDIWTTGIWQGCKGDSEKKG